MTINVKKKMNGVSFFDQINPTLQDGSQKQNLFCPVKLHVMKGENDKLAIQFNLIYNSINFNDGFKCINLFKIAC